MGDVIRKVQPWDRQRLSGQRANMQFIWELTDKGQNEPPILITPITVKEATSTAVPVD